MTDAPTIDPAFPDTWPVWTDCPFQGLLPEGTVVRKLDNRWDITVTVGVSVLDVDDYSDLPRFKREVLDPAIRNLRAVPLIGYEYTK